MEPQKLQDMWSVKTGLIFRTCLIIF